MRYREARPDDALAIATLHAESWRVAYRGMYRDDYLDGDVFQDRTNVWQERMAAPPESQFVVLAEDELGMAGFACAYGAHHERLGTYLDNIHVRRELHRSGVGTALLSWVASWSRTRYPDAGLYLGVLEENVKARLFYERLGATDVGGDVVEPAGGGSVRVRRYAWSNDELTSFS